jgi:HAMP domain-containing protein
MSIAKSLILLLAIPLLALVGLGYLVTDQLARIDSHGRFMTLQVRNLTALGYITHCFEEARVSVRTYLLADDKVAQVRAEASLRTNQAELKRLVAQYAESLISNEEDRDMCSRFAESSRMWSAEVDEVVALAARGRRDEAIVRMLAPTMVNQGQTSADRLQAWIRLNERLAADSTATIQSAIGNSRRNLLIALGFVVALAGLLGFVTFRRIVVPIRTLETSVEAVAAGDYVHPVPFTQESHEIGALARSVDVLKGGAAGMEEQRWIKANVAKLASALQGATSHAGFGERLLSSLVPMLGGGVGGFYLLEGGRDRLRRAAGYGLGEGVRAADSLRLGEGLAGQCAVERAPVVLTHLPPEYLRLSSGLGEAAPALACAWPLLSTALRGP